MKNWNICERQNHLFILHLQKKKTLSRNGQIFWHLKSVNEQHKLIFHERICTVLFVIYNSLGHQTQAQDNCLRWLYRMLTQNRYKTLFSAERYFSQEIFHKQPVGCISSVHLHAFDDIIFATSTDRWSERTPGGYSLKVRIGVCREGS